MKRALPLIALALASSAAARQKRAPVLFAEPGDIISAEGAMTRIGNDKGMKAALRATAAPGAEIFAPRLMGVDEFVKTAKEADFTKDWHTRRLWMSCDGSFGVSYGEWRISPALGWFVTVWHRQKKGAYKWVLNENGPLAAPPPDSDMIRAIIADCPAHHRGDAPARAPAAPAGKAAIDWTSHRADDDTMDWTTATETDGSHSFLLRIKQDGMMKDVLRATALAR